MEAMTTDELERVPLGERIRRLPGALLLTAGYYAGRLPIVRELFEPRA